MNDMGFFKRANKTYYQDPKQLFSEIKYVHEFKKTPRPFVKLTLGDGVQNDCFIGDLQRNRIDCTFCNLSCVVITKLLRCNY